MSKLPIFSLCLALISNAYAIENPILTKKSYSGYVAPGYNTAYECEVFAHKVVMTNTFGQLKYTTTKMIELSGNVRAMLENAVAGPFKSYTYPMDVGSTIYEGNLIISSGSYKNIRLGTKMGDNWSLENQATGAYGLRLALDDLCK